MIHRSVPPRPGITLLEVLTAIFIMGIGMMALLTLFPAGAISMARAVREDRAATMAANAAGIAAAFLRTDQPMKDALGDKQFNADTYQPDYAAAPGVPSNPVLIDPQIVSVSTLLDATAPSPGIQRITPSFAGTTGRVARFFTFQDEITFDTLGNPKGSPASAERPGTYSLAYMVRRPIPELIEVVDLTILVFSQRVTDYADGETAYPLPAGAPITATQGTTTITLPYSGTAPDIRRRSWLMDTTCTATSRVINGDFYRVENVTDAGSSLQIELDRPLKATCSRFVHFRDLIAVIDRGSNW